jgi:hypothetical protein
VDDRKNLVPDGHGDALMTERSDRILHGIDLFDDRALCQDILFFAFLESFEKIVQDHHF